MEKRLYFNALQQAEDDTLLEKRRDELSSLQTQLSNLRGCFEDHVDRYDGEFEVLEDYGDSIRYGLIEIGVFVRHQKLSREERESLAILEKAIMAIHDGRQREPANTDPPRRRRTSTPPRASRSGKSKDERLGGES